MYLHYSVISSFSHLSLRYEYEENYTNHEKFISFMFLYDVYGIFIWSYGNIGP